MSSRGQIVSNLERQMYGFFSRHAEVLDEFSTIKVYYDCGQPEVTRILHTTIGKVAKGRVLFVQGVDPVRYKLFQLADLICTVRLLELKLANDEILTESEMRFFGGVREFKRNVLKKIKVKELA